jgi:phage tail-like protein
VTFTAFNPTVPDGRRFLLWDFIPEKNKREDKTRDLFKVISILQEVTNCLLYDIDRMAELIDPDLAPERFVEAMLADLGNPFPTAELALVDKRRLLAVLVSIYQLKGTAPGVVHAVRFLLGLEVEVLPVEQGSGWILGVGQLSHTAILGPSTLYQRYSFNVQVEEALTPTQRRRIVEIVEFMKPAHTHLLYILEPGSEDDGVIDHVALGYSLLGSNWFLHA